MNNQVTDIPKEKSKVIIEKIKEYKKVIFLALILIIIVFISSIYFKEKENRKNVLISDQFTNAKILINNKKIVEGKEILNQIINKNNKFYSPLSLYFIIDKNLEKDKEKIIILFDKIILINGLDEENKNLIKIKKALFLSTMEDEQRILNTLNPIINSKSIWRSDAIKILGDYFLHKGELNKSNEYYNLLKIDKKK